MTRSLLPVLLCLLLSACAQPSSLKAPIKAQGEILATPTMNEQVGANGSKLMGANGDFGTPTPDLAGTAMMFSVQLTKTQHADEMLFFHATQTQQERNNINADRTATADAPQKTQSARDGATSAALVYGSMTQGAAQITATYSAPFDAATAVHLAEYAKSEPVRAWSGPFLDIAGGIGVLCFGVAVMLLAFGRVVRPVAHDAVQTVGEPIGSIPVTQNTDDADTTPPGDKKLFAELMEYAIRGGALGQNTVVDERHLYRAKDFAPVRAWLDRKEQRRAEAGHRSLFREGPNRSKILSVDGLVWAQDWLDKYHQSPAPLADMAQNMANSQHEDVLHDHFGVLPSVGEVTEPTYVDHFSPERTGYVPKGILIVDDKDGEK